MRALPLIIALFIFFVACGEKDRSYVPNVGDGDSSPTMTTLDVETFISDSGYTRYHISTPMWLMYEDASEPFWRFPEGISLQQYDLQLRPDASMVCDSAIYYSRKRLWRLDGHVLMVNTVSDSFLSQQLFWDQAKRKVYTDSFIHIVRSDRIIEGYGFESNENMTSYTINRPTAILPVERHRPSEQSEAVDTARTDSAEASPLINRRRPAPRRSAEHETKPVEDNHPTEAIEPVKQKKLIPHTVN